MSKLILLTAAFITTFIFGINLGAIFTINLQTYFEQRDAEKQRKINKAITDLENKYFS